MMKVELLLTVFVCALNFYHVESNIVENIISEDGYYPESHSVKTEDGFILEVNRIPYGRFQKSNTQNIRRPVVFLMHGLMASATSYILLGPETSIGYNLADAGYDVWMGNARGVLNSRNHVSLNPNDSKERKEFFDYSFHEIGFFDIAAMIDYVLKTTGEKQLHYIGHSQGGTTFLVLASSRPEYNEKFKSVHLLAGVGYQEYFPNSVLSTLAKRTDIIYSIAVALGYVEVLRPRNPPFNIIDDNCSGGAVNSEACDLQYGMDFLESILDPTRQVHGSAALKQIAHFGQNVRDKSFRRWDYGPVKNIIKYGRLIPPVYDLSLISADVTMHYTVNDKLMDEKDVISMANVMPNTRARKVFDEEFQHSDFMSNPDVKLLVTDYIIDQINQKEQSNS